MSDRAIIPRLKPWAFPLGKSVIASGIITFFIMMFFVEGTIAENYSNERFVAPEFFLVFPVWVIGAVLVWMYFTDNKIEEASYDKIVFINLLILLKGAMVKRS